MLVNFVALCMLSNNHLELGFNASVLLGFFGSQKDLSLFNFHKKSYTTAGAPFDTLIAALNKDFLMKNVGTLHYFLGMKATFTDSCLHLTQVKYIHDIVSTRTCLSLHDGGYRSFVGNLMYLIFAKSDFAFAVMKSAILCINTPPLWQQNVFFDILKEQLWSSFST